MIEKLLRDKYGLKSKENKKKLNPFEEEDINSKEEDRTSFFKALKEIENERRTVKYNKKS
jgi:hypothetical protein